MEEKEYNLTDFELLNLIESLWYYSESKFIVSEKHDNISSFKATDNRIECIKANLDLIYKLLKQYNDGA